MPLLRDEPLVLPIVPLSLNSRPTLLPLSGSPAQADVSLLEADRWIPDTNALAALLSLSMEEDFCSAVGCWP